MNDGYGYDPYGQQPEIVGYDEYGRPVYRQDPSYGTYEGTYDGAYEGAYDPYGQQAQPQQQPQPPQQGQQAPQAYDPYVGYSDQPQAYGFDAYGQQQPPQPQAPQQQPQQQPQPPQQQVQQQEWFPQQAQAPQQEQWGPATGHQVPRQAAPEAGTQGRQAPPARDDREYHTAQFSFVEEPDDDSEDVIDWLKFSESRTERREEAKRRGRNRGVALVVALVLVVAGGVGYLWYAGMLPGLDGAKEDKGAAAGQKRDVIVLHLRSTNGDGSSTALLVNNEGTGQGNTVLLPNSLAVSTEDGTTTTLGKSVEDEGASPTRDALDTLLGSHIQGTWRLDTPFLENMVELVGGIALDTDATVPGKKKGDKPLVRAGKAQDLDGKAAVAYATHRGTAEPQSKQLARFGQVMQATLKKLSSDPKGATKTVESLGQIPDPSLSESELGASLAKLADRAKDGKYRTQVLPVRANGTLSQQVSDGMVKDVLGGTVKNSDPGAALRVSVKNASGDRGADDAASVALVNGGYSVVKGGAAGAVSARTQVTYAKPEQKAKAEEVAKTLGVPSAVRQGKGAANADVSVVLGRDYKG
ncbi:polydiglycosylphosphate transferase PdtA [Streptomyces albiaxialis]|uniref:Polydiglycosylphosphate transferase PdtA n=1 Tax=Streptomyces albiaxialis TaxID=329523 RepID=A0ABP5HXC6_9ACTN